MSSFITFGFGKESIRVGNPTFKLLFERMKGQSSNIPSIARIVEENPIADCIGLINLEEFDNEDIRSFFCLAKSILMEMNKDELFTKSGFNVYDDLAHFVKTLEKKVIK